MTIPGGPAIPAGPPGPPLECGMSDDDTTTIYLLVYGEYEDRAVVGAFETPELAAEWLGRETIANRAPAGPFELETCGYRAAPMQPDVNPVGAPADIRPDDLEDTETLRDALGSLGASVATMSWSELLGKVRELVKGNEAWSERDGIDRLAAKMWTDRHNVAWEEAPDHERTTYVMRAVTLMHAYRGEN